MEMGDLVPCGLVEVMPNDAILHSTSAVVKCSPLAAPVMHRVSVRIHHFFIPHRFTFGSDESDFEDFITGGADGNDTSSPPTLTSTGSNALEDYFGVRGTNIVYNAMPIKAYNLCWNQWYRDSDLDAEQGLTSRSVLKIRWAKDYFTAARPWVQLGDQVTLPLGTKAPVTGLFKTDQTYAGSQSGYETAGTAQRTGVTGGSAGLMLEEDPNNTGYPNVYADLSSATAINVNDLRNAFALQRFKENRAKFGHRYVEFLKFLGVRENLDARLDRVEFLGGGNADIQFSEVMQTAPETGTGPTNSFGVGDMYGHGMSAVRSNAYRRTFPEHGYVLSLISVRPGNVYPTAMDRHWFKSEKEEYFQPELSRIGQQAIWKNEIYPESTNDKTDVFGYADRYEEYKKPPHAQVCGDFKIGAGLDYYHMGRDITSSPTLNSTFVECDPTKRIFNVTAEDGLWVKVHHRIAARRPVPKDGRNIVL